MNKSFDDDRGGRTQWVAWLSSIMTECLRILKPGGHALVWALPRTSHWTALALEDAGFEIRDCLYHLFGSGFPKSMDISKAIDKMQGAEREVIGVRSTYRPNSGAKNPKEWFQDRSSGLDTAPATPEAQQWNGWGTALKPSVECWWLCRKPLSEKSIAANVLKWGTGGLNIASTRVGNESTIRRNCQQQFSKNGVRDDNGRPALNRSDTGSTQGRFPSHLLLSHSWLCTEDSCDASCPIAGIDRQTGITKSRAGNRGRPWSSEGSHEGWKRRSHESYHDGRFDITDEGGASRYFTNFSPDVPFLYAAKASRAERNAGCEGLPEHMAGPGDIRKSGDFNQRLHPDRDNPPVTGQNNHPTVKSLSLMSWLCRLITPPDGIVLDPFLGSGSTAVACVQEGFHFIGIEQEVEYIAIAQARVSHAYQERGKRQPDLKRIKRPIIIPQTQPTNLGLWESSA